METNINKQCLEKILVHLTKLICVTDFEDIKDLQKLVSMSTSVSAQILACDELGDENFEEIAMSQEETDNENEIE